MTPIKTYDHVDRGNPGLSFSISRMESIYDKRGGEKDEPHRHDYYIVILVESGRGEHIIDFNSYPLGDYQAYFLTPGQVHQLVEFERSKGYAISFSSEFLAINHISLNFIDNLNLFTSFGSSPPLQLPDEDFKKVRSFAESLIDLYGSEMTLKYEALGAYLKLLLISCNEICDANASDEPKVDSGQRLLKDYKHILNVKYNEWHGVSDYAQTLNVTPDHLNRVVRSLTGKTAKEHIQDRIIVAAKRMLYFTDLSNKELAHELGFDIPANFSAFFKKCTGISPSQFRSESQVSYQKGG